jgi:hypothetical protein
VLRRGEYCRLMIAGNLEAQPPLDVLAICGTGMISKITLLRLPRDLASA